MLVIYEDNNNFILHWKGDTAARLHFLKHKCNHVTAQLKITNLSAFSTLAHPLATMIFCQFLWFFSSSLRLLGY